MKRDQDSFKKCFGELRSLALHLNGKQPRGVRKEKAIVGEGSGGNHGVDGRRHSLACLRNGQHMFSQGQVHGSRVGGGGLGKCETGRPTRW